MRELIQVKDQTKYSILRTLFQAKEPVTIETLSTDTLSSMRSIKNYLTELKSMVSQLNGSIETSNEGVRLNLPTNIGIDLFERQLIRNTPGINLLELIFHNDQLSSTDLIEKLFLSSSSLNRLIRSLKEMLSSYGLSIEANPYRITGEEILIRKFYSAYFLEAYSSSEWPFEDIPKSTISKLLDVLLSDKTIRTAFYDYNLFRIHFAVDFSRNRKGYTVKNEHLSYQRLTSSHSRISRELQQKMRDKGIDSEDIQQYSNQLAYWYIYYSQEFFQTHLKENTEFRCRITSIQKVVNDLIKIFDLPAFDYTGILKDLDTCLDLYKRTSSHKIAKDYILFKPRDYYLIDIFKNSFYFFYEVTEDKMKKLCAERNIETSEHLIESMMHIILTRWKDLTLILFQKFSTCKILVYSHLNYTHAENIVSSLHTNINRVMNTEIYKEPSISEEQLSKYNFDILISTTTLSLDIPQKIQYLHYKLHGPIVQPVVYLIDEIISENKRKIHEHVLSLL